LRTEGHRVGAALVGLACAFAAPACRQDMHDQPKYLPLAPSPFFADGRASRPQVEGTVARGQPIAADTPLYTGKSGGAPVARSPLPVTETLLRRGRERYDIYCAACHDRAGTGGGMIVERGFRRPESFHVERLRAAPDGHFFDVMTNGFGVMPSYAGQVAVGDRWAIVAYVRALQLSQGAALADVPPAERATLEGTR
jgi:mono/diheme cytochrome c family protein